MVKIIGTRWGASLAPHDVRRTFSKRAQKGQAPLEQIQIALRPASIQTADNNSGRTGPSQTRTANHIGIRITKYKPGAPSKELGSGGLASLVNPVMVAIRPRSVS